MEQEIPNSEPVIAFRDEIEEQVEKTGRISIYIKKGLGGEYELFLSKQSSKTVATVNPASKVSVQLLKLEGMAEFLTLPRLVVNSESPTEEEIARELFSSFIPKYVPYAEGKPIDIYHEDQNKSKGLPALRVCFENDLVVVKHPSQELGGSPSQDN